jgi:hypothetical protein
MFCKGACRTSLDLLGFARVALKASMDLIRFYKGHALGSRWISLGLGGVSPRVSMNSLGCARAPLGI